MCVGCIGNLSLSPAVCVDMMVPFASTSKVLFISILGLAFSSKEDFGQFFCSVQNVRIANGFRRG